MPTTVYPETHLDPIATILHGDMLKIWYLIHHPNTPLVRSIEEFSRKITVEQRREVALRAKIMIEYATEFEKALAKETK